MLFLTLLQSWLFVCTVLGFYSCGRVSNELTSRNPAGFYLGDALLLNVRFYYLLDKAIRRISMLDFPLQCVPILHKDRGVPVVRSRRRRSPPLKPLGKTTERREKVCNVGPGLSSDGKLVQYSVYFFDSFAVLASVSCRATLVQSVRPTQTGTRSP